MNNNRVRDIKKAQKESQLYQILSSLLMQITIDDTTLLGMSLNRIKLSDDKGVCTLFFYIPGGTPVFEQKLARLVLYKASLRKAIASQTSSRYTPQLVFRYDTEFEQQERIENLLEKIKKEEPS